MVVAPGSDGTLGILPQHAPLITTLAAGELRVKKGTRSNRSSFSADSPKTTMDRSRLPS